MNTFTFTGKAKLNLLIVMVVGLALIGLGSISNRGAHSQDHEDEHADSKSHALQENMDHAIADLQQEGEHDIKLETPIAKGEAQINADGDTIEKGEVHNDSLTIDSFTEEQSQEGNEHAVVESAHGDEHGGGHGGGHHEKVAPSSTKQIIMANFWAMTMLLFWMGMAALFFQAAQTAGWAGWHIMIQKVTLSIMTLLPFMMIIGVVVFIFGHKEIFIWTNKSAMEADELMMSKQSFLNIKTFAIFSFIWCAIILTLYTLWWKKLHKMDVDPDLKHFSSIRTIAAFSIVLVAIINAFGVWHWMMSIEPNWYSTLYAWYTMASAAGAMFAFTILAMLFLQSKGYLPNVTTSHYHDVAKYMFAVSVFWAYLWFSQFMLIWYGNIPEETIYFAKRMHLYPVIFYGAFIINFFLTFLVLIKRDAKRNKGVLIFACTMIIIGHWFDFFNMIVVPNVAKGGMGLISVGSLFFFCGLAGFIILSALSRFKSLDSREHPYYQESLKHHI